MEVSEKARMIKFIYLNNFKLFKDNDCGDNSDEELTHCINENCTAENQRFRCNSGHCIRIHNICNGELLFYQKSIICS
jgi:hypothetical protein